MVASGVSLLILPHPDPHARVTPPPTPVCACTLAKYRPQALSELGCQPPIPEPGVFCWVFGETCLLGTSVLCGTHHFSVGASNRPPPNLFTKSFWPSWGTLPGLQLSCAFL